MNGRPAIALGICPNELSDHPDSRAALFPTALPAAGVSPSAPAASPSTASAQEGCPLATAAGRQDQVTRSCFAPAAVVLSEASLFILTLIAKHDGVQPQAVLTRLIAERAEAIGLSPLLGRHFDEDRACRETIVMRHHDIRAGSACGEGDLASVPDGPRVNASRYRSGGP